MRDTFYADKRDLIKWGILHRLAELEESDRILQIAYFRSSTFASIQLHDKIYDIPDAVLAHFRNIRNAASIHSRVRTTVFDIPFEKRTDYHDSVTNLLSTFAEEKCLVFLDPDTGLEPDGEPGYEHVLNEEANQVWLSMRANDTLAIYQHQTNRKGQPWIEPKRIQLAESLGIDEQDVFIGQAPDIARDVVLYYTKKLSNGQSANDVGSGEGSA
jgi:hypothetical protein